MKSYYFFSHYYDSIVRWVWYSLKDEVDMIDNFVKSYLKEYKAKSILEVACWTWVVARELLKKWYDVIWIDLSEEMIQKAEENMWEDRCELADMRDFDLKRTFDVVLCNYNSICHLIYFKDWRRFFLQVCNHLNEWGLFIFDINTIQAFENISKNYAEFFNFKHLSSPDRVDVVCLEMFKKEMSKKTIDLVEEDKQYYYEWLVKMFIQAEDSRYDLIEETIPENSFKINFIQEELKSFWFKMLHLEDFHKWKVDEESERVYFVAKKI